MNLSDVKTGEWAVVFATLLGPILAVQAQKWLDRARKLSETKYWVCSTLMATRLSRISLDHVRALNMIDLAFYGVVIFGFRFQTKNEKSVTTAWKTYLDDLGTDITKQTDAVAAVTLQGRETKFIALLGSVAIATGYSFDDVQLSKGAYSPVAHGNLEVKQQKFLDNALAVVEGKQAIRMDVTSFPVDEKAAQTHKTMVEQIVAATADGRLKVNPGNETA